MASQFPTIMMLNNQQKAVQLSSVTNATYVKAFVGATCGAALPAKEPSSAPSESRQAEAALRKPGPSR